MIRLIWNHIELQCTTFPELYKLVPIFEKIVMNKPLDITERAYFVTQILSNNIVKRTKSAAQEIGRLGGLKGGKARRDALSPERRKEIAQKAAKARWG